MNKTHSINLHLLIFLFLAYSVTSTIAQTTTLSRTSREELATAFSTYHAAKDINALMGLRLWDGVPEDFRTMEVKMLQDAFSKQIVSISFTNIPEDTKQMMEEGIPYHNQRLYPNLQVEAYMVVEFENGEGLNKPQMPIGQKDGVYYIASVAPRPETNKEQMTK